MEQQYLNLLHNVLLHGDDRMDRTGVGTRALFGQQLRCRLYRGFPLLTTKHVPFKPVLSEMLWFVEGSGDERRLAEILHGTTDPEKKTIWTANAEAPYWKPKAKFEGDLGRVYGVQWRHWKNTEVKRYGDYLNHYDGSVGTSFYNATVQTTEVDQLANIVKALKDNPTDRRMVLTAFNVGEIDQMALPPCHMFAQFFVNQRLNEISCQVYIRSNDLFLGLPFNIASYAILTHMLANTTGRKVGELIITIGDAHIYNNHFAAVEEQLQREPRQLPELVLQAEKMLSIDEYDMSMFKLEGYNPHPAIKAPMAV